MLLRSTLTAVPLVAALAGCVVPVTLDFNTCVDADGQEHVSGDSYQVGCHTCTCTDGVEYCAPCECLFDDGTIGLPGTVGLTLDGCNSCTCLEDGTLDCGHAPCPPTCSGEPVACPPTPPGCVNETVCTDIGWACQGRCEGCDEAAADAFGGCPAPPDSCWWSGPICENGAWVCGELICDGCQGEPIYCPDPGIMGCTAFPVCLGSQWGCDTSCEEPYCPEPPIDCYDPMLPPECVMYPICTPMGWACIQDCYNCTGPAEPCESMQPECVGTAFCDGLNWQCQFVCQ